MSLTESDWMEWSEMMAPYDLFTPQTPVESKSVSTQANLGCIQVSENSSNSKKSPATAAALASSSAVLTEMSETNTNLLNIYTKLKQDQVRDQQTLKDALEDKAKMEEKIKTLEILIDVKDRKISDSEKNCLQEKSGRISAETKVTKLTGKLEEFHKKLGDILKEVDALSRGNTIVERGRLQEIFKSFENSIQTHKERQKRLLDEVSKTKENLQCMKESLQSKQAERVQEEQALHSPKLPLRPPLQFPLPPPPPSSTEVEVDVDPYSILHLHDSDDETETKNKIAKSCEHAVDTLKSNLGYFCVCGRNFNSQWNLKGHVKYYTIEQKFFCPICPQRFPGFNYLKKHVTKAHHQWPYPEAAVGCRSCGEILPTREKYLVHRKRLHGPRSRKVSSTKGKVASKPIKGKRAASSSATARASASVSKSPPRRPRQRLKTAKTKKEASQRHAVKISRGVQQNSCICGAKYSQRGSLIAHIIQRTHQGGQFPCSVCGKRFDGTGTLRTHSMKVHKSKLVASVGCRLCGKVFKSHSQLHLHRSAEHIVNEFGRFNLNQDLKKKKTKAETKGCKTEYQDRNPEEHSFTGSKMCPRRNREVHQCRCGKEFSQMKLLNYHIKAMEKGRIFVCDFCNSTFYSLPSLKSHCRFKHKVDPASSFGCRDCGRIFSDFTKLYKHRLENH